MKKTFFDSVIKAISPFMLGCIPGYSGIHIPSFPPFSPPPPGTQSSYMIRTYENDCQCSYIPHTVCGQVKTCQVSFSYNIYYRACHQGTNGFCITIGKRVVPGKRVYTEQCDESSDDSGPGSDSDSGSSQTCPNVKVKINTFPYKTGTVKLRCNNN